MRPVRHSRRWRSGRYIRAARAVIVGDPKQVDPVVTDDLALLKAAYTDEVLIPYREKEADEVIFLLGCDDSNEAKGAVQWVNANIVNVAATRAKYRLYMIGDANVWEKSVCVSKAKEIMDRMSAPC